jgi:hypothetical protein
MKKYNKEEMNDMLNRVEQIREDRENREKKMYQSRKDFFSGIMLSSEEVTKMISDIIRETQNEERKR